MDHPPQLFYAHTKHHIPLAAIPIARRTSSPYPATSQVCHLPPPQACRIRKVTPYIYIYNIQKLIPPFCGLNHNYHLSFTILVSVRMTVTQTITQVDHPFFPHDICHLSRNFRVASTFFKIDSSSSSPGIGNARRSVTVGPLEMYTSSIAPGPGLPLSRTQSV